MTKILYIPNGEYLKFWGGSSVYFIDIIESKGCYSAKKWLIELRQATLLLIGNLKIISQ